LLESWEQFQKLLTDSIAALDQVINGRMVDSRTRGRLAIRILELGLQAGAVADTGAPIQIAVNQAMANVAQDIVKDFHNQHIEVHHEDKASEDE
jgi:hypothetical protein